MASNRFNVPTQDTPDSASGYEVELDVDEHKVYVTGTHILLATISETPDGSLSVTTYGSRSHVTCLVDAGGDLFYDVLED